MTDNQMMILIIAEIERQLTLVGFGAAGTDFEVGRNHQPTNQHTDADKDSDIKTQIFLYAITKGSDGHGRNYITGTEFKRTDFQQKHKSIQVSVAHYFNERDINARTPEDIADLIHDLLDSPDAIQSLRDDKIYLENVGDVRPVFFANNKDRYESMPNFDVLVNYSSSITKVVGYVDSAGCVVEGV